MDATISSSSQVFITSKKTTPRLLILTGKGGTGKTTLAKSLTLALQKEKKKVFEAKVTKVDLIKFKDLKNNDKLAKEEGYSDTKEMTKEFKKMYVSEIKDDDLFQIIYFEKLDIDEWVGDKIDEKAMITQRADILFDSGKYDKSVMCYTAALGFDPEDVYLLNKI